MIAGLAGAAIRKVRSDQQQASLEKIAGYMKQKLGNGQQVYNVQVMEVAKEACVDLKFDRWVDILRQIEEKAAQPRGLSGMMASAKSLGEMVVAKYEAATKEGSTHKITQLDRTFQDAFVKPAIQAARELKNDDQVIPHAVQLAYNAHVPLYTHPIRQTVGSLFEMLEVNPQSYLDLMDNDFSAKKMRETLDIPSYNIWAPAITGLVAAVALMGVRRLPTSLLG